MTHPLMARESLIARLRPAYRRTSDALNMQHIPPHLGWSIPMRLPTANDGADLLAFRPTKASRSLLAVTHSATEESQRQVLTTAIITTASRPYLPSKPP